MHDELYLGIVLKQGGYQSAMIVMVVGKQDIGDIIDSYSALCQSSKKKCLVMGIACIDKDVPLITLKVVTIYHPKLDLLHSHLQSSDYPYKDHAYPFTGYTVYQQKTRAISLPYDKPKSRTIP